MKIHYYRPGVLLVSKKAAKITVHQFLCEERHKAEKLTDDAVIMVLRKLKAKIGYCNKHYGLDSL